MMVNCSNDPTALRPRFDEAGLAMQKGDFERAKAILAALRKFEPYVSLTGLGAIAAINGEFDEAEHYFSEALNCSPDNPMAIHNLGFAKVAAGKLDEGLTMVDAALTKMKSTPEMLFMKSAILLKKGRWKEGWALYESRLESAPVIESLQDFIDMPKWTGEDLNGKILVLVGEQGAGDRIQFVRYATILAERGARVVACCAPSLKRLFETVPGVTGVVPVGEPIGSYDYWVPMFSVPAIVGTDENSIPSHVPYLFPSIDECRAWADRLNSVKGLRVGLAWAGNPNLGPAASLIGRRRSIPLALFAPLWDVEEVTFFSLQKGQPPSTLAAFSIQHPMADYSEEWHDFADTAAFISALDLVICVDTSIAHLAGAMGKPVWILSRFDGCWRWLTNREDSPWYPSARIFQQEAPNEWASTIKKVSGALSEYQASRID